MKTVTAALIAHVDAGKTTLAEALLHRAGVIRTAGRVDKGSTVMDSAAQERARGITVFTGEATFIYNDTRFQLLDAPGHLDLAGETERALWAADCAVLVISGAEGIQAGTLALWRFLRTLSLPVVLFVSKMDRSLRTREELIREIQSRLAPSCLPWEELKSPGESAAMLEEELLDRFLEGETLRRADALRLIRLGKAHPILFGSGLKEEGLEELLEVLRLLAADWPASGTPAGLVYKVDYDEKGTRLTHLKLLKGTLRPREEIRGGGPAGKIAQIRVYTGSRYEQVEELRGGSIAALTGLNGISPGEYLDSDDPRSARFSEPILEAVLELPDGPAPELAMPQLSQLREEEPSLRLRCDSASGQILVDLKGPIQAEILCSVIRERFGWEARIGTPRVLYRETVREEVEGVGHYEPLRHFAEVHLLLRPLPRGSGLRFVSEADPNRLPAHFQRLILSQLKEALPPGVLTGAELTDMEICLAGGKAHPKHTEGGDFRQAAQRALRQGLMQAREAGNAVLLEPYVRFQLQLPRDRVGRALADIRVRSGSAAEEENAEMALSGEAVLTGRGPLETFREYGLLLTSYTGGAGRFQLTPDGYDLCHNSSEVLDSSDYIPQADRSWPPESVFCTHGAGVAVAWDQVPKWMHLPFFKKDRRPPRPDAENGPGPGKKRRGEKSQLEEDAELEALMLREFGPIKRPLIAPSVQVGAEEEEKSWDLSGFDRYIVDGYNLIFCWEEMKAFATQGLEIARTQLIRRLENFAGYAGKEVLLVFDGYRVEGNPGEVLRFGDLTVMYTPEHETADMLIERYLAEKKTAAKGASGDKNSENALREAVVSNDNLIRLSAIRQGALRIRSEEFIAEVEGTARVMAHQLERGTHVIGSKIEGDCV